MTPASRCPHCAQPLHPFAVKAPSGEQVELGRCAGCAGFWGARGILQKTFGEPARHHLVGGTTTRACVECRILLTPSKLPSGTDVEVCSACHGMFLDAGELAPLGVREKVPLPVSAAPGVPGLPSFQPPVPAAPDASEPPPGTFRCVECGRLKPLREGQALRDGLACRVCMRARLEG